MMQPASKTPQASLNGDWQSTTSRATLRFDNGKLNGNDGCNRFGGTYSMQGNEISVSDKMMSTMMACPNMERSSAFTQALKEAKTYQSDGKELVLLGRDDTPLLKLFHLSKTLEPLAYYVTNYNNGKGGVVSVEQGSQITIELKKEGRVIGSTGCNEYVSTYSLKEDKVTFGYPATTRKMCTPSLMEQESAFTKALSHASVITRDGDRYELRDESGALQVILKVIIF
jgi:heat shock protein HslJ